MQRIEREQWRWFVVFVFATAMAWVEASVVFYLRTMIDRIEPYQPNPFPTIGGFGTAELVREAATLMMLFTVGLLAGRNWRSRCGYMLIAFGVWDIFYYVFLKMICGWPHSLLDWDILFLIPLPWWGPVLAPISISLLMILWGTLASQFTGPILERFPGWKTWTINCTGVLLALYIFMADALRVANRGLEAIANVLPTHFEWPLFAVALVLMSAPIIRVVQQLLKLRTNRAALAGASASKEA